VYRWVALAIVPMLLVTHLPQLPLWALMLAFSLFMVLVSGRTIRCRRC
jgi:cell division protein FtsW (lipid II flippase)